MNAMMCVVLLLDLTQCCASERCRLSMVSLSSWSLGLVHRKTADKKYSISLPAMCISDQGTEETAIAAYWVTDGVDRCRVGFMPRHYIKHSQSFDGGLVQVVELLRNSENSTQRRRSHKNCGMCICTVIDGRTIIENKVKIESKVKKEDEKEKGPSKKKPKLESQSRNKNN